MAITGVVWVGFARSRFERCTAWVFAIPALLGMTLVHFSRPTVLGDLVVVLVLMGKILRSAGMVLAFPKC